MNLRNDLCHGLIGYNSCEGSKSKYLWWFWWKLCVLYKLYM
ncbi:DUF4209 domain-containing protein [Terrisporobacter hibernicus]|uniref:DUF4209 domain-containing protein n=1 Tax=Terrisporobacter hibernicus TaxID=2813371 RepID=A0AAX2ZEP8_9FIRM|nr:hypothetical protein JW646_16515 [Terrisporobacter hibernicus]